MRQSQRRLPIASIAIVLALAGLGQGSSDGRVSAAPLRQAAEPDIALVEDSETPGIVQADGKTIRWDLDPHRWPRIEVDFRVRPLRAGHVPVSNHASVDFEDWGASCAALYSPPAT